MTVEAADGITTAGYSPTVAPNVVIDCTFLLSVVNSIGPLFLGNSILEVPFWNIESAFNASSAESLNRCTDKSLPLCKLTKVPKYFLIRALTQVTVRNQRALCE